MPSVISRPCEAEPEVNCAPLGVVFELTGAGHDEIRLNLTINFYPAEPLDGIALITFRSYRLSLEIQGGEMPLGERELARLEKIVKTERKTSSTRGTEGSVKGELSGAGFKSKANKTASSEERKEDSRTIKEWQILAGGEPSKPFWDFKDQEGKGELVGAFPKEFLGILRRNDTECRIWARITAYPRDLKAVGMKWPFPSYMSENKNIVMRRWLCKRIEEKCGFCKKGVRLWLLNQKCFEVQ